ncbi:hypothetical protein QR680_006283 [Steinernema hermaphroditum]|uniref:TIL domain-containing protein n=1 Tax=Steinernema hermaphroditum TaxID=289476 RepID=A0AA39HW43_9BILA|nr:hypothetical protein QR680_006283 [Steinernema hermaphroditum]
MQISFRSTRQQQSVHFQLSYDCGTFRSASGMFRPCYAFTVIAVLLAFSEALQTRSVINFCGEHEQWNVCGDVEPTCDDPFPVYVDGCGQSACQCVIGYVRKGRECVKLADCSKPSCTRHCEPGKKCTLQWHLWGWSQHCISRRRRGIRPFKGYFGSSSEWSNED